MATASVWNWERLDYDYYQTPEKPDLGGWETLSGLGQPGSSNRPGALGIDIEDALPQLPKGSKKYGRGLQAKGRIMRVGSPAIGMGTSSQAEETNWIPLVAAAAVLVVLLKTQK